MFSGSSSCRRCKDSLLTASESLSPGLEKGGDLKVRPVEVISVWLLRWTPVVIFMHGPELQLILACSRFGTTLGLL